MLKVLIPIAPSSASRYAIKHAIHRVWKGEALDIHLLYVQPPAPHFSMKWLRCRSARLSRRRRRQAIEPASELLRHAGLRYSAQVCSGTPAHQIVRYAEAHGFASIVMASTGLGSISEMVLGSVTAKVLRTSRIPVEVVPAAPRSRLRAYAGPAGLGASLGALFYAVLD